MQLTINDVNIIKLKDSTQIGKVQLINDKFSDTFILLLKLELDIKDLDCPGDNLFITKYCMKYTDEHSNEKQILQNKIVEEINDIPLENIKNLNQDYDNECKKFIKCLLEYHYIYLETICDYIAGMTDNYANKQFNTLFIA